MNSLDLSRNLSLPDPPDGLERILLRLGADTDKLKDE